MAFNVSGLITDLNRKVSPGNVSKSRDIFGAIAEGARAFIEDMRPKELSRRTLIENALYDQVKQFTCPPDLNEQKIIQWYKLGSHSNGQGNRNVDTMFHPMMQVTNRAFDKYRPCRRNEFTIEWQTGVKFIKVTDFQGLSGVTISTMNSLTDNGTWNVFGNVVNLTEDHLTYIAGNGSFRFDMNTSSATGGIEAFNMTPVDLSEYFVVGKIFTWMDIPNLNQLQTVTLDMFSSPTDYYSITVNSPHDSTFFQVGQNLLGFPFDPDFMNTIGTPNPRAIDHIRFTFTTNGTLNMNSVRIDNVVARKGAVFGIQYLSEYAFEDVTTGLWKLAPTAVSDVIHLEPATYNVLLSYCAVVLGQEIFTGADGRADLKRLEDEKIRAAAIYRKHNKTEFIDEQQQPYNWGVPFGYRNGWNGYNQNSWDNQSF